MIERIVLRNVRVHREIVVDFPSHIGVLFGNNGIGKTTILESVYALTTLKSFRSSSLFDMVTKGFETGSIEGRFFGEVPHRRKIDIFHRSRALFRDGVKESRIENFLADLSVVCLAPEHQELVHGGPEGRRRYLDHLLFGLDVSYLTLSRRYQKALTQKQALLRQKLSPVTYLDLVLPWESELVVSGDEIRSKRMALVEKLAPGIRSYYQALSKSEADVRVAYQFTGKTMAEEIEEKRDAERYAERVLTGCHRDDLAIDLSGESARETASQGEKSSLLLALKMAETEKLEMDTGRKPMVLLDDIGNTLDQHRRAALFSWLQEAKQQVLVSTADPNIHEISHRYGTSEIVWKATP